MPLASLVGYGLDAGCRQHRVARLLFGQELGKKLKKSMRPRRTSVSIDMEIGEWGSVRRK